MTDMEYSNLNLSDYDRLLERKKSDIQTSGFDVKETEQESLFDLDI